ncbi:FAST kinase domain-containing protein 3, mitochondrial [Protopterus annectens]|uniref:FAST kinase domain-containing protein 3, mitochondrial n=1 Tax=Protopterus annectens TaxID=7888 RepID=UPI001CFC3CBE|nr:FAST kinase domain-containing protein 3, mitochondrial [Protopterus annectens]XP_043920812.1 FAST kinase domain-containing protein 3, mitochondrial [Protopterus annectens]
MSHPFIHQYGHIKKMCYTAMTVLLRRPWFQTSSVQAPRTMTILRQYVQRLAIPSSLFNTPHNGIIRQALPNQLGRFIFPSAPIRVYHLGNRDQLQALGGCVHLHDESGNSFRQESSPTAVMNENRFMEELSKCTSVRQVFKLLNSLILMSDTMAAAALLRVSEVEQDEHGLKSPQAVLEDDVFKALCFQFEQDSHRLSDTGLVTAMFAFVQLYLDPWSTLMVRLVSEGQERLDRKQLTVKNLCLLGEVMLALEGPGCVMLKQVMEQVQQHTMKAWTPEEMGAVYNLLQSGAGEGGQYQELLNRMNDHAVSMASRLDPKLISQLLFALVVLDQTQAIPLVISLCKHSVRHVPYFSDDELVRVLTALMHFGHSDKYFTEALERHVPKKVFTMHPEAVSKVMQYCSRRLILSVPIFDTVAESFVYNADRFTTSQIARQIMPFGKLNYVSPNSGPLFRKLESILRNRFSQFQPRTLLSLLHACTLIERFPVNFVAKVFSPYFLQQLEAQRNGLDKFVLAQLTQLFMTVTLECPFYEGPRILPKYQVKSFLIPGRSLESPVDSHLYSKVKAGLTDLLGARIYFASRVLTPYCYTLDAEIKLDEEGYVLPATHYDEVYRRIALCIDDQKRFCTNTQTLLGIEAIKQRHLRLLGYEVVQIPFYEFEKLQHKKDVVDYLHGKIFPHSFRLSW